MTATKKVPASVQLGQPRGAVERLVEQHAVDDEPHEERLDHLEAGGDQREHEEAGNREAVRPQPVHVVAQVFAPLAGRWPCLVGAGGFGFSRRRPGSSSVRSL